MKVIVVGFYLIIYIYSNFSDLPSLKCSLFPNLFSIITKRLNSRYAYLSLTLIHSKSNIYFSWQILNKIFICSSYEKRANKRIQKMD